MVTINAATVVHEESKAHECVFEAIIQAISKAQRAVWSLSEIMANCTQYTGIFLLFLCMPIILENMLSMTRKGLVMTTDVCVQDACIPLQWYNTTMRGSPYLECTHGA